MWVERMGFRVAREGLLKAPPRGMHWGEQRAAQSGRGPVRLGVEAVQTQEALGVRGQGPQLCRQEQVNSDHQDSRGGGEPGGGGRRVETSGKLSKQAAL